MDIRTPTRLAKGNVIGIVSPGSPIDDLASVEKGVNYLERLGYRTAVGKYIGRRVGYLAGTDEERAEDIHMMFADKRVKAVFAVRGGYGSPRLLMLLDYRLIARNPKIFVGYSDITALHLAFWSRSRLVTYHGPMLGVDMAGEMDPFAEEALWRLLTAPQRRMMLVPGGGTAVGLRGDTVSGRLLGGNLSLLVSLLGTPYQPDFRRTILFLEEIGEEPYRVDRMLSQLRNSGILSHVAGIATGNFTNCTPKNPAKPSLTVGDILQESATAASKLFLTGLPFGHERKTITVPLGIRARVDGATGSLELLEPAVL